jgi:hypothetical protein
MSPQPRRNFKKSPEAKFHLVLAEALSMTREELLRTMSSAEMTDWMAFFILRGEEREEREKQQALNRR